MQPTRSCHHVCHRPGFGSRGFDQLERRVALAADKVGQNLTFPDQTEVVAADENLSWQGPRVVVRRHDEAIGTSTHDRDEVAFREWRHGAVLRKKITAFTNGSNDIDRFVPHILRLPRWDNFVITLIKGRTNQIVHSGVDDREFLLASLLHVTNAREKDASVANQKS